MITACEPTRIDKLFSMLEQFGVNGEDLNRKCFNIFQRFAVSECSFKSYFQAYLTIKYFTSEPNLFKQPSPNQIHLISQQGKKSSPLASGRGWACLH